MQQIGNGDGLPLLDFLVAQDVHRCGCAVSFERLGVGRDDHALRKALDFKAQVEPTAFPPGQIEHKVARNERGVPEMKAVAARWHAQKIGAIGAGSG